MLLMIIHVKKEQTKKKQLKVLSDLHGKLQALRERLEIWLGD